MVEVPKFEFAVSWRTFASATAVVLEGCPLTKQVRYEDSYCEVIDRLLADASDTERAHATATATPTGFQILVTVQQPRRQPAFRR